MRDFSLEQWQLLANKWMYVEKKIQHSTLCTIFIDKIHQCNM